MPATDVGQDQVGYYSVLRYVPDAMRDEAINIGLFVVDEDATWARFDARAPRTILGSLGRRVDAERIDAWVARLKESYVVTGDAGLLPGERIGLTTLEEWAREWGGMLRVAPPKVALASDLEELWGRLYRRLVRHGAVSAVEAASRVAADTPRMAQTGQQERKLLLSEVRNVVQAWPLLHPDRVVYEAHLDGRHAQHRADVAFMNGKTAAIGQILPLQWGQDDDVIVARALITEAAADFPSDVVKMAIYADPPAHRRARLTETAAYFAELPQSIRVDLVEVDAFGDYERRITPLLELRY